MAEVDGDGHCTVEIGVAESARSGHQETGDRHLVVTTPGGMIIAVIDGLGHGLGASRAADIAVKALADNASRPLSEQVQECHESLRRERGVVLGIARIDQERSELHWIGIGDVQGMLIRGDRRGPIDHLLVRSGIVGGTLPLLREETARFGPGDMLVVNTDGVRPEFGRMLDATLSAQQQADCILESCGRTDDDSLVLVARLGQRLSDDQPK